MKLDKIKEKMDKVKQDFYKINEKINGNIQKAKEQLEAEQLGRKGYEDIVNAEEATRKAERESAINSLNKVYEKAQEKLKDQVGFGESNPAAVTATLNNLDTLSSSEKEVIAKNWQNAGNYIGMKALRENDVVAASGFKDIQEQQEELNNYYSGKLDVISKGNYSSDIDKMLKQAEAYNDKLK